MLKGFQCLDYKLILLHSTGIDKGTEYTNH